MQNEITKNLRCLICQGQSVYDSDSEFAMSIKDLVAEKVTFENKSNFYGSQVIGGAIFETILDLSHPINYGKTRSKMPIFRNSTIFLDPDTQS